MTQFEFNRRDKIARTVARNFVSRFPRVEYDDALQTARVAYLSAPETLDATANPDATLARCLYFRLYDQLRRETMVRGVTPRPETVNFSTVDAQRAEREETSASSLEGVALSRWRAAERRERVAGWVRRAVEKTLSQSPERVGELYRAYFERGETLKAAGAAFGLSESRTSQIITDFKRDVASRLEKERAEQ